MPRKWMAFQIAAVLIMAVSLLMLIAAAFQAISSGSSESNTGASTGTYIFIVIGFAIMFAFSMLCLYILRSKFPDKYIPPKVTAAFKVSGILAMVFAAIFILGLLIITSDILERQSNPSQTKTELYLLIGFVVYIIISVYVFIVGQKMIRSVNRAFLANEQALIDSLGKISP